MLMPPHGSSDSHERCTAWQHQHRLRADGLASARAGHQDGKRKSKLVMATKDAFTRAPSLQHLQQAKGALGGVEEVSSPSLAFICWHG